MTTQLLASPTPGLMTVEEFFEFVNRPDYEDRLFELDCGMVVELERPGSRHGFVCANACYLLSNFTWQRGRGIVVGNNTGLIVERAPDTVFGPDVFLLDEAIDFAALPTQWVERSPSLIVEVLSPYDCMTNMNRRVARFLAMGVPLVWVLDPADRTLAAHHAHRPLVVLDAADEVTGQEFIPDLKMKVADFFVTPGAVALTT